MPYTIRELAEETGAALSMIDRNAKRKVSLGHWHRRKTERLGEQGTYYPMEYYTLPPTTVEEMVKDVSVFKRDDNGKTMEEWTLEWSVSRPIAWERMHKLLKLDKAVHGTAVRISVQGKPLSCPVYEIIDAGVREDGVIASNDVGKTRAEWAEEWGKSRSVTGVKIRELLKQKKIVRGTRTGKDILGRIYDYPVYREVE